MSNNSLKEHLLAIVKKSKEFSHTKLDKTKKNATSKKEETQATQQQQQLLNANEKQRTAKVYEHPISFFFLKKKNIKFSILKCRHVQKTLKSLIVYSYKMTSCDNKFLLLIFPKRNHRAQFYSKLGSTTLKEIPREVAGSPQADSLLKTSDQPPLTSTPKKKGDEIKDGGEAVDPQLNLDLLDGKVLFKLMQFFLL